MRKIYTTITTGIFGMLLCTVSISAQTWCTPTTATPYNQNMPGITFFSMNTISRTSADLENYPNNSYVNTGLSTNLTAGNTYNVSISYTIDASICPDMNLRVWIDLNQDGQLDDPGETLLSVNNQTSLSYTGTVTIPSSAMTGTTRMRVTAKMTSNGGHTSPTPCDIPVDPFGYHGEFEDYTVVIAAPTAVASIVAPVVSLQATPNPSTPESAGISYSLNEERTVTLEIYNTAGQIVAVPVNNEQKTSGNHTVSLASTEIQLAAGIYFARITAGDFRQTAKLVIRN
ncbi:MAG: peptidase M4, thermolysin [Bacteroidetes bacterium]|nr:MAG: peptidase M4, thermolysin [Bacteroidota bacterium]